MKFVDTILPLESILTDSEKLDLKGILAVLKPCYETTTYLEGEKYATLSASIPLLMNLAGKLAASPPYTHSIKCLLCYVVIEFPEKVI